MIYSIDQFLVRLPYQLLNHSCVLVVDSNVQSCHFVLQVFEYHNPMLVVINHSHCHNNITRKCVYACIIDNIVPRPFLFPSKGLGTRLSQLRLTPNRPRYTTPVGVTIYLIQDHYNKGYIYNVTVLPSFPASE